jgi:hypothetical protein
LPCWTSIEKRLGRLTTDDRVGNCVGVTFMRVRGTTVDTAGKLDTALLLDVVGRLVSGGVKIWLAGKPDRVANGECLRTQMLCRIARLAADMRTNTADVVLAEGLLDRIEVRQALTAALRARLRDVYRRSKRREHRASWTSRDALFTAFLLRRSTRGRRVWRFASLHRRGTFGGNLDRRRRALAHERIG